MPRDDAEHFRLARMGVRRRPLAGWRERLPHAERSTRFFCRGMDDDTRTKRRLRNPLLAGIDTTALLNPAMVNPSGCIKTVAETSHQASNSLANVRRIDLRLPVSIAAARMRRLVRGVGSSMRRARSIAPCFSHRAGRFRLRDGRCRADQHACRQARHAPPPNSFPTRRTTARRRGRRLLRRRHARSAFGYGVLSGLRR